MRISLNFETGADHPRLPADVGETSRFLIIRRDNIGDLVCTTPLIHALRTHFPRARLCALVNSYNAPVLENNPDIDRLYVYTKGKHRPPGKSLIGAWRDRWRLVQALRREHFDCVILAGPGRQRQALKFARAARPRHILGYVEDNEGAGLIDLGMPYTLPAPLHEAEDVFRLLAPFGITGVPPRMRVYPSAADIEEMRAQLAARRWPEGTPLIGIHISARKAGNRWPEQSFVALVRKIHATQAAAFLLLWSPGAADDPWHPGDDAKAAAILRELNDIPVLPYPTVRLGQLIAALSVCRRLICSDGGAMHIAAALDIPILCFFGNSNRQRWYPWGVPHVLLQPPSRNAGDIGVDEAFDGFQRLEKMVETEKADDA